MGQREESINTSMMWKSGVLYLVSLAVLWGHHGLDSGMVAAMDSAPVAALSSAALVMVLCWFARSPLRWFARRVHLSMVSVWVVIGMSLGCVFVRVLGELATGDAFVGYPAAIVAAAVTGLAQLFSAPASAATRAGIDTDTVF